ncbi:MAG: prepilin-type N-terminal cleavage/methylation domain-containing protein [Candidatus Saccharibacteria bacterium]
MSGRSMKRRLTHGFTIVEILIVVVVIGILVTIVTTAYSGAQQRAYDVGIISDADAMNTAETNASTRDTESIQDYSSVASDQDVAAMNANLDFKPTQGNIVDVKATSDGQEFCIRVYNSKSRIYNSAFNAYQISSSKTVDNGDGSCSYNTPPTVYSGGAVPGAYETVYTVNDTYVWPTNAAKVEVAVIGAGGNGAIACGGGGGGLSTAIITTPGTYTITVGSTVAGSGAQAGSSSFGPITATGGRNGSNNCLLGSAGGTGTTTGGTSQKYGTGGAGGSGGFLLLGLLQLPSSGNNTGGGGAGGKGSISGGGAGANGTYAGGGGGGGAAGLLGIGCFGPGAGGNPGGLGGTICTGTGAGNGGAASRGGGGGGASDVSGATAGAGGGGLVRVLTCFTSTCNPESTPIP